MPAVTAKPTIIINQTMVAAAARRSCLTRIASMTNNDVPAAPTPKPINTKPKPANSTPEKGELASCHVESVAHSAPTASVNMPPIIHGVRREP